MSPSRKSYECILSNILLTELLRSCFFYPFSCTVTMFPVSVILKVLRPFSPDSVRGRAAYSMGDSGPLTGKGEASEHATPLPPRVSISHGPLAYLTSSAVLKITTVAFPLSKYSICIFKKNHNPIIVVSSMGQELDGARHWMGMGKKKTAMPQSGCLSPQEETHLPVLECLLWGLRMNSAKGKPA